MANDRYFAVPVLNSHRREETLRFKVEPAEGVKVALGMEIAYAPPAFFPSASKFVERVFERMEKINQPVDGEVRSKVLAVAQDEEARDPYLVASGSCTHSVHGEISRAMAERLASDRNGPAKLDAVLDHPEKLVVEARFRDIKQLVFQVSGEVDPTKVMVRVFAGKVPILKFPLYVAPIVPKRPKP